MTPKGQRVIKYYCDQLYDTKGHGDLYGQFDLVYDPKMSRGSLEVALTYFVTPKATVTFVVGLTPKGHMIIRGCRDLLYDPQRPRWPLWSVWPSLLPQKVTGSLEVAVTYFRTPKVTVTFVVGLT